MFARQDNPNMSRDGYTRTRSGYGWDVCRIVGLSSQTLLLKRRRTVKVLAKEPQWLTPWHGLSGDELGRSPPGLQLARRVHLSACHLTLRRPAMDGSMELGELHREPSNSPVTATPGL